MATAGVVVLAVTVQVTDVIVLFHDLIDKGPHPYAHVGGYKVHETKPRHWLVLVYVNLRNRRNNITVFLASVSNLKNNNNLTFILRFKHTMQT